MADDSIRIEYNQDLEALEELLSGVTRAGDFFVHGAVEIPMPKVEVAGVGVLSFPVPPVQIAALIRRAVRAPYGRGEETILDESVRKVWQLSPDQVTLGGKSWAAHFDGILQRVIAGLGCEGLAASAELYKVLVYDAGGFFLAHRDTEKAAGMFGTLVVVLPSAHRGGELTICHAGREATVDLSGAEVSEVSFAAFYADCEHEVRPITDGHRVCLVFNLIQPPGAKKQANDLHAPDYEEQIVAAAELLEAYLSAPDASAKIGWLLEHQYSPDGLSFAGLKSVDAARVQVLAQAAERADCAVHLGVVHIEESGAAEEQYDGYSSRGWRRYREDDDEEEDETGSAEFEVIEVCDWRHFISEWRDARDAPVAFGEIPIAPGELLPDGALDGEKPDAQRLMEASGNEGASFERSYHRAALVIWRRARHAEVLLQAGVAAALPYLQERIAAAQAKGAPATARKEAVALAWRVVNAWKGSPEDHRFREPVAAEKRDEMLRLLVDLGDAAVLEKFVSQVVTRDYDGRDNAALVACAERLGAEATGRLFAELARQHTRRQHGPCVALLRALVSTRKPSAKAAWRNASRQIGEAIVSKLDEIGSQRPDGEWADWRVSTKAAAVDSALVAHLLDVLHALDASALRAAAAEKFAARPAVFDPVTVLVPALATIRDWDCAADRFWAHGAEFLWQRSGRPPEAPADWRQDVALSCTCADCRELQIFTLDPVEQTHRFRVRKERRQHLHQQIEKHRLDMTHVTDRQGSPQTLVCTKDRRSYRARCRQYRQDIAALASLDELAKKWRVESRDILQRIAAARALAAKWTEV
jgi:hypothetical protein